jgi:hypothetical protein
VVPPGGGQIVSWSTQGGFDDGTVALEVWRPTATPDLFALVGITSPQHVAAGILSNFRLVKPIRVHAGDLLGERFHIANCVTPGGTQADDIGQSLSGVPIPKPGSTETLRSIGGGRDLNIAAVVADE